MKTILGTISADILRGTAGNDTLFGGDGNDTLDGGLGADSMAGGKGNDIYYVDALSDEVIEDDGGGIDTVRLQLVGGGLEFLYKMSAHVENLEMLGTAGYYAWGNELDNVMTGNSGDNLLSGFGGNDTLNGGAGNDQLFGGDGNDSLDGGTGADTMAGGKGNDIFYVDSLGDVVTEAAGEGIDTVRLSLTKGGDQFVYKMSANVENLEMLGTADLYAQGNELDNVMTGNSGDNYIDGGSGGNDKLYGGAGNDHLETAGGNDILDGGTGADFMDGGNGNDIYYVDNLHDVVRESADGGIDTIRLQLTGEDAKKFYFMPSNVENLEMQGTSTFQVFGNDLDNVITGNSGDNFMDGETGNDTLYGGDGNDRLNGNRGSDTIYGGNGDDTLHGMEDDDTLYGDSGDDWLLGGDGNDRLNGGKGDDTLVGGSGNDVLTGGAGHDFFQFDTLAGVDHITDFKHGQDFIQLFGFVFTNIGAGEITAKNFSIHAGGHATRASDRIIYDEHTGKLYYDADGSGHRYDAVLFAVLDNHAHLTAWDFTLI